MARVWSNTVYERTRLGRQRAHSLPAVGRMVDAELLVGASDIATRLGLRRPQHVHTLYERDAAFPEPVARIGATRTLVWYWPDVEAWANTRGPGGDRNP